MKHGLVRAPGPSFRLGDRGAPRLAFTLVEMLVVLAIILVLSAMLFPVLETALGAAEGVSCLSNMRTLGLAARMYADDHDGRIVPAMLPAPPQGRMCWDMTLQAYLNNTGLLICPTDECPRQLPGAICAPHSYGINLALAEVGGYMASSLNVDEIADPVMTILFCELAGDHVCTHGVDYGVTGVSLVAYERHGPGSYYTFVDGHAKWLRSEATGEPELLWDP